MNTFSEIGLLPTLQETLVEKQILRPTEIQARALPALLGGRSIAGIAETGSGKMLAYALPAMHHIKSLELAGDAITLSARPRALVVVPTRELGEQVTKAFKPFTHTTRLRVRSVLGGTTTEVAKRGLAGAFEILVATAGLAVHIPSAKAGGLGEQLHIIDFADRLRIGLETEPRIVEISEREPLPLGIRAERRTRKRRRLRSGTPERVSNAERTATPNAVETLSEFRYTVAALARLILEG